MKDFDQNMKSKTRPLPTGEFNPFPKANTNVPMPEVKPAKSNFQIGVKITDLDFFKEYNNLVYGFLEDKRIDIDIRMYYYDRFYELCDKYDV
jgi:hypothetical protein